MSAIIDYGRQATLLLASQFGDAVAFKKVLRVFMNEVQQLEVAFQQLRYLRSLLLGDGAALDQLGVLLDLPRGGLTDAEYRAALRLRIFRNTCDGSPNELIEYFRRVSNSTVINYTEGSASFEIEFNGDAASLPEEVLRDVAPAGVAATATFVSGP